MNMSMITVEFMLYKKDAHEGLIENDVPMANYLGRKQTMVCANFMDQVNSCLHNLGWNPEKVVYSGDGVLMCNS